MLLSQRCIASVLDVRELDRAGTPLKGSYHVATALHAGVFMGVTLGSHWGYTDIMEKKMNTTTMGLYGCLEFLDMDRHTCVRSPCTGSQHKAAMVQQRRYFDAMVGFERNLL